MQRDVNVRSPLSNDEENQASAPAEKKWTRNFTLETTKRDVRGKTAVGVSHAGKANSFIARGVNTSLNLKRE